MEEIRDVGWVEDGVEDVGECKEASVVGRGEGVKAIEAI